MKTDPPVRQLLLDTHALIWWATGERRLSKKVKRLIGDPDVHVWVSAASAWEVSTKVRLGRLVWNTDETVESYCVSQDFDLLPISFVHAERAGAWPQDHGDPFDRMLAAQGELERIPLATHDAGIRIFGVETIW